jgi:dolichol kinase
MDEYGRQTVHLIFGTAIAAVLLIPLPGAAPVIYAAGLLGGLICMEAHLKGWYVPVIAELVGAFERNDAFPGKGSFYFVASALFCSIIFRPDVAFVAVLSLAILDAVATIAGIRFGRHRIVNGRTLEGSLSGFAALCVVLLTFSPPALALTASVVAAFAELVSPVDDNLVIPLTVGAALTLLPVA